MSGPDKIVSEAVDLAREAAVESAADFGVGEHLGFVAEAGSRSVTHFFECQHPGYRGWRWAVTVVRASRARRATVNEVVLLPGDEALHPPAWVPWVERVQPGDVAPGTLLPTADNDPRLEPGYTGGELAADQDAAEWAQTRTIASDFGLGRERVLTVEGRSQAAERWLAGPGGPNNASTKQAPGVCVDCGYFIRLTGGLGHVFGVCANEYSPSDAQVVSVDHGCGGHSDVVAEERGLRLPEPVYDTINVDQSLFD